MPKKVTFTREEILDAAFQLFQAEGMDGISARRIAGLLHCSTAPVYSCFANIEEIKKAVLDKSINMLSAYTEKEYTPNLFLNMGFGLLEFAKDHGIIYRTLFIENNHYHSLFHHDFTEKNLAQMKKEPSLSLLNEEDLRKILNKMTVHTHGLACCICSGMLKDTSSDNLMELLDEVGDDIIGATILKKGKLEAYLKQMGGHRYEKNCHHQRHDQ